MGTVLEKANKIKETKNKLKEAINDGGGQITNDTVFNDYADEIKNIYIDAINNGTENIYNNFPKTTEEGSEIILNTEEGPMNITLEGNTSQNTSILPEEYTQVDYLQSNGTQYIDTGFIGSNTTSIEVKFRITTSQNVLQVLGAIETDKSITFNVGTSNTAQSRWGTALKSTPFGLLKNEDYVANLSSNGFIINNSNMWDPDDNDFTSSINLYLFTAQGSTYRLYGRIYYCKIYDNEVLVRDFIPCYRNSDSEIGLYDIVNDVFYTNQGTGVFTYGSTVQIPNPDYPQDIKVVTGEQAIKIINKNILTTDMVKNINTKNNITTYQNTPCIKLWGITGFIETGVNYKENTSYSFVYNYLGTTMSGTNDIGSLQFVYTDGTIVTLTYFSTSTSKGIKKHSSNPNKTLKSIKWYGWNPSQAIYLAIDGLQLIEGYQKYETVEHQEQNYSLSLNNIELVKIGNYKDYIFKNEENNIYYNSELDLNAWYYSNLFTKINSYNGEIITTEYISTTGGLDNGATIYYYNNLNTPIKITDTTLIQQLENINNNAKSYLDTTTIKSLSSNGSNQVVQFSAIALKNIDLIESEWEGQWEQ